jgi:hypothetical protein
VVLVWVEQHNVGRVTTGFVFVTQKETQITRRRRVMHTALYISPDREGSEVTSFYLFFVLIRLKPTCRKLSGIIPRMNESLFSPPYVMENESAEFPSILDSPGSSHPDGPHTGFAVTAGKWYVLTLCWGTTYLLFP